MKLAISNIAWAPAQDVEVAAAMRAAGADAVELAPTTCWPDPLLAKAQERRALRERWEQLGFPIVALQSLLFGRPDLQLFDPASREELRGRLAGIMALAADLGATRLVFGSPKNRVRGALSSQQAFDQAVHFFRALAVDGERLGVTLCIEPNPVEYGCDFITTAADGRALVEAVNSPGFGLHLDAAGMLLAGDDASAEIAASRHVLCHVHLSSPQLGAVGPASPVDAAALIGALRRIGYAGTLSIEMRSDANPEMSLARVRDALNFATACLRSAGYLRPTPK
jgi:sugar phosphate isomerase/epimerase